MAAIKETKIDRNVDLIDGSSLLGETDYAAVRVVRSNLSSFIDRARTEQSKVLITDHMRPAAAVVPVKEYRILKLLDRIGVTERLSELTYKDLSLNEALAEVEAILQAATNILDGNKISGGPDGGLTANKVEQGNRSGPAGKQGTRRP